MVVGQFLLDKSGNKYYYGSYDGEYAQDSVLLKDANGNTAHWPLCRTEDLDGNSILYYYHIENQYSGTTYLGKQLWLESIRYTGNAKTGDTGIYTVFFSGEHCKETIRTRGDEITHPEDDCQCPDMFLKIHKYKTVEDSQKPLVGIQFDLRDNTTGSENTYSTDGHGDVTIPILDCNHEFTLNEWFHSGYCNILRNFQFRLVKEDGICRFEIINHGNHPEAANNNAHPDSLILKIENIPCGGGSGTGDSIYSARPHLPDNVYACMSPCDCEDEYPEDLRTDARWGFLHSGKNKLRRILIYSGDSLARSYSFCYGADVFGRAQLQKIRQWNADCSGESWDHDLRYYNDIPQADSILSDEQTAIGNSTLDNVADTLSFNNRIGRFFPSLQSKLSPIGSNRTWGTGMGGGADVGIGYNFMGKDLAFAYSLNGSISWGKGLSTLTDINGDGLPDILFVNGNKVYYRLQNAFSFGQDRELGINTFLQSQTQDFCHGPSATAGLHGGANWSHSMSVTSTYFSDINGDGFLDLVDGNRAKTLVQAWKSPVVDIDTSNCDLPAIQEGDTVNLEPICLPEKTEQYTIEDTVNYPYYDVVRVWQGGTPDCYIGIYAPAVLLTDTLEDVISKEDSIIVSIELLNINTEESILLAYDILTPGDTAHWGSRNILDTNIIPEQERPRIIHPNSKFDGDTLRLPVVYNTYRIFFRARSLRNQQVSHLLKWDAKIKYFNLYSDVLEFGPGNEPASLSQLLQGNEKSFICPFTGSLRIEWNDTVGHLSNNKSITRQILHNNSSEYSGQYNNHQVWSDNLLLQVDSGDIISFIVSTDDINEHLYYNQWHPRVYYETVCYNPGDGPVNVMFADTLPLFEYYPVPYYHSYSHLQNSVAANQSTPSSNSMRICGNNIQNIRIYLMSPNGLLWSLDTTFSVPRDTFYVHINAGLSTSSEIWVECYTDSSEIYNVEIDNQQISFNSYNYHQNDYFFGDMYNCWGQFQYKQELLEKPFNMLDIEDIRMDFGKITNVKNYFIRFDNNVLNNYLSRFPQSDTGINSISIDDMQNMSERFQCFPMLPNGETRRMEGMFPNCYIAGDIISLGGIRNTCHSEIRNDDSLFNDCTLSGMVSPDNPSSGSNSASGLHAYGAQSCISYGKYSKVSKSTNTSLTYGALFMGNNIARSNTVTINDVMDINGDGYPDLIHKDSVLFSKSKSLQWDTIPKKIFSNTTHQSRNELYGENFTAVNIGTSELPKNSGKIIHALTNFSSSNASSTDSVEHTLIDLNGDGLPDLVYATGMVRINNGYGFLEEQYWPGISSIGVYSSTSTTPPAWGLPPFWNLQETQTCSWSAAIGGGIGRSCSENEHVVTLADINGDGLPDLVHKNYNGKIICQLNTGSSFDTVKHVWTQVPYQSWGVSNSVNMNIYGTFGYTWMGLIKLSGSGNMSGSYTSSCDYVQISDFNGDGISDFLTVDNNGLHVRYARLGRTGLLKKVENPLGGSIVLDYEMTDANVFHSRRWVLKEVKLSDNLSGDGADTLTTRYGYQYGYYDHAERRFSGFAKVSTFEINTNGDTLRTTERFFANNNVHLAGQILAEVLYDSLHRRYVQTTNQISLDTLGTVGGAARVFPKLNATRTCYFEGLNYAPITRTQTFAYENHYGNLVRQSESSTDQAKITANIFYHTQYNGNYCVNKVSRVDLRNGANVLLRRRTTDLDAMGHITAIHDYFDSTHCLSTRMEYDTCGNITVLRSPNTTTHFAYDSIANTYPVSVTDTFGIASYMQDYDYRFGVPRTIVDRAGNRIEYTLDAWGRTLTIRGPKEIAANRPYTLQFSYYGKDNTHIVPMTKTEHYDPQHPANPIKIYTYCDGLGRIVQTRKEAAVNGVEKLVVSGLQQYDALGRIIKSYYPTEAVLSDTVFAFVTGSIPPATVVYDVLDRPLLQTAPDGSSTAFQYGFEGSHLGKMLFKTTTTDANHHSSIELKDVNGTPWAIKAAGQPFVYFDYNAAGDNIRVYSSIANDWERIYAYDLLGRKLSYTEGNIVENYAYTGNLLTLHTQQYYDNNVSTPITSQTTYTYNAHRLQSVNGQDEVPVVYHYDCYGRVDTLYDESGLVCYQYGNMGEITRETRIYTVPFLSNIIALSTQFEYDSWGRILNINYPDNEEVNYSYDFGGQLERIANNQNYTYLDSIQYNKFGAKISQKYGNGIQTKYTYYPLTQRLDSLLTTYGGNTLSYLQYNYDSVGNIIRVNSSYPMPQYQVTERYSYDSADQLLTAESTCNNNVLCSGAYSYNNWGKINTYTQQTTDPATNISENKNYRYYFPGSSADMTQGQTSFAPIIKYDMQQNTQPLETCTYGINGSIRKRVDHQTQNTDYYYFNASGNLKACGTDMQISLYGYNSANTRTYKVNLLNANQWLNGQPQPIQPMVQSAMFYPNSYINFNQGGDYTKHYYSGTERIASRLGEQQIPLSVENNQELEVYRNDVKQIIYNTIGQHLYDEPTDMQEGNLIPLEFLQATGDNNAIFYYHPNHLASTMYVTDAQQSVVQSFLYAPYGDIISEYNPGFNGNVLPNYAFNAKELDEETGMYYYEARYYNPPIFISRDPLMSEKPWLTPYHYCSNNPVGRIDPTGMSDDWYLNAEGKPIYDKNVNENTQLGEGERYVGKTANWCGMTENDMQYRFYGDTKGNLTCTNMETFEKATITYAPSTKNRLSDYSTAVLLDNMFASGMTAVQINSTSRSPEDQARIMLQNLKNNNKIRYALPGKAVESKYTPNASDSDNYNAMLSEIYKQGPSKVSLHCGVWTDKNVFDIQITSKSRAFDKQLRTDSRIKYLSPYDPKIKETCHHIEIIQPK